MKIKIFKIQNKSENFIEDEINKWLDETKPKIHNILQSQSSVQGNSNVTTLIISVFYE